MPLEAPVISRTGSSAIGDRVYGTRHAICDNSATPMDPDRKRRIRLVVALGAAVLLAGGLDLHLLQRLERGARALRAAGRQRRQLRAHRQGGAETRSSHHGTELRFEVADRDDPTATIPVVYTGTIPDPFREGREVIVSGTVDNGTFVAEKDSLITKCPSKFSEEADADPEHVIIE